MSAELMEKAISISHGLTRMDTDIFSVGDPDRKQLLQTEGKHQGAVVEVTGYASEEETPRLLASARVHLITMSPGWEGVVVPSKLYGCIRTGRPVLFIGPDNADTAREILANEWGAVLPPSTDGREVAAAILELAARPMREVRLKQGAREVAEQLQLLATADCKEPQMAPRQTA
jgi:glycosyltransferase involved in cell wall biosynthesis